MASGTAGRSDTSTSTPASWTVTAKAVATGFVVLLTASAVVFASAQSGRTVAAHAATLQQVEAAFSATGLSRAYVAQAVVISVSAPGDAVIENAAEQTNSAARGSLASLEDAIASLAAAGNEELGRPADLYVATARRVLDLTTSGQGVAALTLAAEELDPTIEALQSELAALQKREAEAVSAVDTGTGRIADITRWVVGFLVPASAVVAYWWAAQRQRRTEALKSAVEAERSLVKAKDEFIASVSHELRTPLTGITGFARLLADADLAEEHREMVDIISDESTQLTRLVEDLLTAARFESGGLTFSFEAVQVEKEVAHVLRSVSVKADVEVDCRPGTVWADRVRYRQVITNLLVNAERYGGAQVWVRGRIEGGVYRLVVADNGPGVPSELEERIFDRFVRQDTRGLPTESVGLGLSIVRMLCEEMGGSTDYERTNDETQFIVEIPVIHMLPETNPTPATLKAVDSVS